mgnify:CR=1 FL=1
MANKTFNNPILKGWLNVYVIINVIYIIYLWGSLIIAGKLSSIQSLETSLCTIMCITNIVGIVYLSRSLRFGVYILYLVPIIILVIEVFLIDDISISIYLSLLLSILTNLLLYLKSENRTIWSQMNDGIDIVHFKHIYQLSTVLILLSLGYGIYSSIGIKGKTSDEIYDDHLYDEANQEELLKELDKTTITLSNISKIEKRIKELPPEYEARIMALRHILAGHIVPNTHDFEAFKMAYFLRKDAMSKDQQEILDWFFRQHNDVMEIWRTSDGCSNLAIFQEYIKDIIKKRKLTEF